jgi:hypothetical protein
MELKKAIKGSKNLTDSEKEYWCDRAEELKAEGMQQEDVADQVILEMKQDADKDLAQLKTGLGKK